MSAEVLSLISLISYIVAGVCLAIAILLWFVFKIPVVVGDLTGRTARKSIAKMRANNEKSGAKSYRSSEVNAKRVKLTDTMPDSKELVKKEEKTTIDVNQLETGLLAENAIPTAIGEQTTLLVDNDETGLLDDGNETTLLQEEPVALPRRTDNGQITIIDEVILIHTTEVIV